MFLISAQGWIASSAEASGKERWIIFWNTANVMACSKINGRRNRMNWPIKAAARVLLVTAILAGGTLFGASDIWAEETSAVSSQQSPPTSEQAKRIEAMVNKAAALVEAKGKAAFSEFRTRDSEWWFGNTYLFVYDKDMNVLLNPAFPKREGTNVHGDKDAKGKLFHDEFMKAVRTKGSGWVDYMFPKPGETKVTQKWSYVKAVNIDGGIGLIGAGFYPE
jgi:cytochrome c